MARRRKDAGGDLSPEQKREARRRKRQLRKQMAAESSIMPAAVDPAYERNAHDEDQFWLGIKGRLRAEKVLNTYGIRPFWLSIKQEGSIPPLTGFFPCVMFTKNNRFYFGFLFRDHRDRTFTRWRYQLGARKELTGPGQYPLVL